MAFFSQKSCLLGPMSAYIINPHCVHDVYAILHNLIIIYNKQCLRKKAISVVT